MHLRGYGRQQIEADDLAAVAQVLQSDALTGGPAVAAFEDALRVATTAPHALACSNGTTALHLALWGLGIGEGDAVIVPTLTFLATANAARYVGAEVVFADVDPSTGLLTHETILAAEKRALEQGLKIAAVIPVHLNGQSVLTSEIIELARERGWRIVEDACHALGTRYGSNQSGLVGDATGSDAVCFSFHPVKTIAMGEGGAVTTRDPVLAERVARLRSHGMTRDRESFKQIDAAFDTDGSLNPWYYEMPELGHNFRVSDINCALGTSQLTKLGRFIEKRRDLVKIYDRLFSHHPNEVIPVGLSQRETAAWHIYVVQIDFQWHGTTRAKVMRTLADQGIGTQVHYIPVHTQPYYTERYGQLLLPGADRYYARALTLPLFPAMSEDDVETVVDALLAVLG